MNILNIKLIIGLVVLLSAAGITRGFNPVAQTGANNQPLELPAGCESLQVDAGNKVAFHVYAIGDQIYKWNGGSWDFVAPAANLYANADYDGQVGTHYAGPTWKSNSGSKVVGTFVSGCTPDPTAIPWLKLRTVSSEGPGIFSGVTFIQRVNTTGGVRPTTPGSFVGEEKRVPYTTEYYFYRAED